MASPSDLSFLGIAKEVTPGVFVPSSAYIGANKIKILNPADWLRVLGFRGSMVEDYGLVQGFKWGGVEIGGPVYIDTIGWLLGGIMGDLVNTGSAAPYSTAMSVKNSGTGQPTTHSVDDYYVAANRGVAGVTWHDLEIKWSSDGLLEFDAKGTGLSTGIQSKPTASITAVLPSAAWRGVLTIGGVAVSTSSSGSFKFTRKPEVLKLMNSTQVPTAVFVGPLTVDWKYKAIMDDETELTRYLTNAQPTLDVLFSQGSGAALTSLQLHCSIAGYNKDPNILQETGKPVYIEAEGIGIGNATDAGASGGFSPAKVTVQNATAAGATTWQ